MHILNPIQFESIFSKVIQTLKVIEDKINIFNLLAVN